MVENFRWRYICYLMMAERVNDEWFSLIIFLGVPSSSEENTEQPSVQLFQVRSSTLTAAPNTALIDRTLRPIARPKVSSD